MTNLPPQRSVDSASESQEPPDGADALKAAFRAELAGLRMATIGRVAALVAIGIEIWTFGSVFGSTG